jgi:hypothetical protein
MRGGGGLMVETDQIETNDGAGVIESSLAGTLEFKGTTPPLPTRSSWPTPA